MCFGIGYCLSLDNWWYMVHVDCARKQAVHLTITGGKLHERQRTCMLPSWDMHASKLEHACTARMHFCPGVL